jgi:hypothetical protein
MLEQLYDLEARLQALREAKATKLQSWWRGLRAWTLYRLQLRGLILLQARMKFHAIFLAQSYQIIGIYIAL